MNSRFLISVAAIAVIGSGAAAVAQNRQAAANRTATYWMSADTTSGMMAGAINGGGRPTTSGILGAMMSGRAASSPPAYVRRLQLQLGSSGRATGAPSAEHLPPSVLGAGASLPLLTPRSAPAQPATPGWPPQMEQPRGRILVYWGCGEHARPGQPLVIDLARLAPGQIPPAFAQQAYRPMIAPSATSHSTYGEWPNERSDTQVPANGSLVGDHVVRGNYSPEIRFTLAQGQDFLAPVTLSSNTASGSGAVPVGWQPVPNARAWSVMTMGAGEDGTMVMWNSSETQMMGMMDYLSQDEIARLLQQRALLPPQTQQCTVPAEVARAAPNAMLSITAFGPEANFSHPARPANARAGWTPEWAVKLRTRSAYMGMLGMDMEAMMRGESGDEPQPERRRRRSLRDRLLGQ